MFKKMQKFTQNAKAKKALAICMSLMVLGSMFVTTCFAADGADMTPKEAATSIFTSVSETVNIGSIAGIIGIALGAGIALYFAWWGIRKVVRMLKGGLNGKISV